MIKPSEVGGKFKFDTTVNVAHVLTTIGLIILGFSLISDIKTAIATNTSEIGHLKAERTREAAELRAGVHELNIKVDRLIERGLQPVSYKLDGRR